MERASRFVTKYDWGTPRSVESCVKSPTQYAASPRRSFVIYENQTSATATPPHSESTTERFPTRVKYQIKEEQDFLCAVTGKEVPLYVHHIIPRSQGGLGTRENGVAVSEDIHEILDVMALEHGMYYEEVMNMGIEYAVGYLNGIPDIVESAYEEDALDFAAD